MAPSTSGAIDLSAVKQAEPAPDFDSLSDEDKAALAAMAEEHPDLHPVTTAFVVIIERSGQVVATQDLSVLDAIVADRAAVADDIIGASAAVTASLQAQQTAAMTQQAMMQAAAMAAQRAQEQQLMQQVGHRIRKG